MWQPWFWGRGGVKQIRLLFDKPMKDYVFFWKKLQGCVLQLNIQILQYFIIVIYFAIISVFKYRVAFGSPIKIYDNENGIVDENG